MALLKSKDEKLFKAVEGGDPERVKKLLETGASVDASTADGSSQPLHQACTHGMADVARILLDKGADVNKRTKSDLAVAIASGLMEHLTEGKSSGATGSLLGTGDGRKGGSTPLMFAALSGDVDLIKLLLAHPEIDVNARNNAGATALSVSQNGEESAHKKITALLERAGALDLELTVTTVDSSGKEPTGTAMPLFAEADGDYEADEEDEDVGGDEDVGEVGDVGDDQDVGDEEDVGEVGDVGDDQDVGDEEDDGDDQDVRDEKDEGDAEDVGDDDNVGDDGDDDVDEMVARVATTDSP